MIGEAKRRSYANGSGVQLNRFQEETAAFQPVNALSPQKRFRSFNSGGGILPAEELGAAVADDLRVHALRFLRGEQEPHAVFPCLCGEAENGILARRRFQRGNEILRLVYDEKSAKSMCRMLFDPTEKRHRQLIDIHLLCLNAAQSGKIDDGYARPAFFSGEKLSDVRRFARAAGKKIGKQCASQI